MNDNALIMVDRSGVIRHWSACAEEWFGHSASAALGRTLDIIVPEQYRSDHWRGFQRAVETGSAATDGQSTTFPVLCKDGAVKEFRAGLTLLRNAGRRVIGALVIFEPVDQSG